MDLKEAVQVAAQGGQVTCDIIDYHSGVRLGLQTLQGRLAARGQEEKAEFIASELARLDSIHGKSVPNLSVVKAGPI